MVCRDQMAVRDDFLDSPGGTQESEILAGGCLVFRFR